jgi:hypothetical protein
MKRASHFIVLTVLLSILSSCQSTNSKSSVKPTSDELDALFTQTLNRIHTDLVKLQDQYPQLADIDKVPPTKEHKDDALMKNLSWLSEIPDASITIHRLSYDKNVTYIRQSPKVAPHGYHIHVLITQSPSERVAGSWTALHPADATMQGGPPYCRIYINVNTTADAKGQEFNEVVRAVIYTRINEMMSTPATTWSLSNLRNGNVKFE